MSTQATNLFGKAVNVGDQCTIQGLCTSVTGTTAGNTITVGVTTILGKTISIEAGDCHSRQQAQDSNHYARTTDAGHAFGAPSSYEDYVSINGVVQSVSNGPIGQNGTVIVKT